MAIVLIFPLYFFYINTHFLSLSCFLVYFNSFLLDWSYHFILSTIELFPVTKSSLSEVTRLVTMLFTGFLIFFCWQAPFFIISPSLLIKLFISAFIILYYYTLSFFFFLLWSYFFSSQYSILFFQKSKYCFSLFSHDSFYFFMIDFLRTGVDIVSQISCKLDPLYFPRWTSCLKDSWYYASFFVSSTLPNILFGFFW